MADAMPGAAPAPTMEDFAAFEQIRQEVSPSELNETLLATAAEADPLVVAEFKAELRDLELPPEILDAMNTMVDEILASPERYAEIRADYLTQDMSEELLPETFDPEFFGALNIAIDEIRATSGSPNLAPQGFARGGVASLRPISAAMLARQGRNGDTMLAHVTPEEMRLLKSRGGSGTINPITGLPEFFGLFKAFKKVFKKIGKVVKKFASSTVGKIIISTALFVFAGPMAVQALGLTAGTAGAAAVSGFVAGAGTSLLAGNNLKDSLKAGAIGGITAGAIQGVSNAFGGPSLTGGDNAAPISESVAYDGGASSAGSASNLATGSVDLSTIGTPATPGMAATSKGLEGVTRQSLMPSTVDTSALTGLAQPNPVTEALAQSQTFAAPPVSSGGVNMDALVGSSPPQGVQSLLTPNEQIANLGSQAGRAGAATNLPVVPDSKRIPPVEPKSLYQRGLDKIIPSRIKEAGAETALAETMKAFPNLTQDQILLAGADTGVGKYMASKMPGMIAKYLPLAAAGVGVMGLTGGFDEIPSEIPPGFEDMAGDGDQSPGQRLLELYPERYKLSWGGVDTLSTVSPPSYTNYASSYKAAQGSGPAGVAQAFPEKDGHINGPGTGTSDDVPAMLSDGEFVFTAKAVRNMGQGSRRKGAKKMYALMKKLEGAA
jgi:hypothetical protein